MMMVMRMMKRRSEIANVALVCLSLFAALALFNLLLTDYDGDPPFAPKMLQRALDGTDDDTEDGVYPWAERNLKSITEAPDPANETPLFWTIPKSGDTSVKRIYKCLDLTVAIRAGALDRYGHNQDGEIVAFRTMGDKGPSYVNVDPTSHKGILRAKRLGLVPSGRADIIFTSLPNFATTHLYDDEHRGRAFVLFRNPVDRLVSLFYYLQVAKWERSYRPDWADMSLSVWARDVDKDHNSYVKQLAGLVGRESPTEKHLQLAMDTLKEKFVVGLTEEMKESIRRFNIFMGIHGSEERSVRCMDKYFGGEEVKTNSNPHPKVEEGDSVWKIIAETNSLDMKLWDYVLRLFDEQKSVIDSYGDTTNHCNDGCTSQSGPLDNIAARNSKFRVQ